MSAWDDALFALLAAATLVVGWASWRAFLRVSPEDWALLRRGAYVETMAGGWALAGAVALRWAISGRSWEGLGLARPWLAAASAGALAASGAAAALWPVSPSDRARLAERHGPVAVLLPRTPGEARLWVPVSISAGITEEMVHRGFLLGWLAALLPAAAAVAVSAALFAAGHAYQGRRGILVTAVLGMALGALRLASGSLYPGMGLHAAVDLWAGIRWHRALAAEGPGPA